MEKAEFVLSADDASRRLDRVIRKFLTALPLSRIYAAIRKGNVRVNGRRVSSDYKTAIGDVLTIDRQLLDCSHLSGRNSGTGKNSGAACNGRKQKAVPLPVLLETDDLLIINKPAGMLVHAKGGVAKELTVADYVRSQFDPDELASNAGNNRLGIVHRLDRTTSGVMICARNLTTASYLSRQFAERKVKKVYLALVSSLPGHSAARINLPIRRSRRTPSTFVVDSNGKVAITDYTVQKEYPDGRALLELRPLTGRTHQLRVHLAYLGCPIVGDAVYGHARYGDRLMLHAYQLEISIPGQDGAERRIFTAPLPADFREAIGD